MFFVKNKHGRWKGVLKEDAGEKVQSKWGMKKRTHAFHELLTANLQFTLHCVFTAVVDCFARIHSPIKWTGLTDLQRQDTLLTDHPVLGFI